MNLDTAPLLLPGLVVGLTVHEFAHAWSASLLGDDFSRRQGRVSLNPLRHLTPLGTLAILFLPFGWGRPVPVNLYNFARPRRDYLLTSLAGPAANALATAACLGLMCLFRHPFRYEGWEQTAIQAAYRLLMFGAVINAMLAVLNLIPLPPLDGSKIWTCALPAGVAAARPRANRLSLVILVMLLCTNALQPVLGAAVDHLLRWMPVSDAMLLNAYRDAGDRMLEESHWRQADFLFGKALEIHPRDHLALASRAKARAAMKNWSEALTDIRKAIRIMPCANYSRIEAQILRDTARPQQHRAAGGMPELTP
ncbi:MAG: site-2 protease family protein [Thermoguttaceae bacterium]